MKSKIQTLLTIIAGVILMIVGIGLSVGNQTATTSGILTAGMVMIIIGFIGMIKKKQGPAKDELTRKIADRAAAYSWVITLITLMIVFWLNQFEVVKFSVNAVISIVYFIMIATMIAYQQIFWRRGDVE